MNVTLPNTKLDNKNKILYSVIIVICVICLACSIFYNEDPEITVGDLKRKNEKGYENLKEGFDKLFTNELLNYENEYKDKKIKISKDLVYTKYIKEVNVENSYDLNVNIPYINVKSDTIEQYNDEIESDFQEKAEQILGTKNKKSLYTVEYSAYIQDGILSVAIKANLKEGSNAQRVIVKTYNYSLEDEKEIDLEYLLNKKNVDKNYVQNKIQEVIKSEQQNAENIKASGYKIFERNPDEEMYQVDNVEEFYYRDGSIYILFPYGNDGYTSELDIVVL